MQGESFGSILGGGGGGGGGGALAHSGGHQSGGNFNIPHGSFPTPFTPTLDAGTYLFHMQGIFAYGTGETGTPMSVGIEGGAAVIVGGAATSAESPPFLVIGTNPFQMEFSCIFTLAAQSEVDVTIAAGGLSAAGTMFASDAASGVFGSGWYAVKIA